MKKKLHDLAHAWVRKLATYEPGRPIEEVARELGFADAEEIIKLASNENALGPSPKALAAMRRALTDMHLYPDGSAFYLRRALAAKLGVDMDQIMVGHGSNEIIALLGQAFLRPGTNIVMADRAFVVYRLVADAFRARTIAVPMKNFTHDLDAMLRAITPRTRLVFIANPNNPTGTMVDGAALDRFMRRVPAHVAVVLDEAYIELLPPARQPDTLRYVRAGRHVFVLRTFSKTYGLAGLRVGYALAPREGVDLLNKVRQPFNVNAMALAAAEAALADQAFVTRTRRLVAGGLKTLERACARLGLECVPSVTNFILVKVGPGRAVCRALEREQVIIRPMDGYGLPEYIRVTVGRPAENAKFIRALTKVLKS
ncbi:MAG: histidinol-phosphate transaminase [Kiritimatiellaeota bacterium]|nr:histidinol-phosphate transaminase [Kiritimatiellota bacterium]